MFWGVTLETGKRYSQVVDSSYHLSMAALEALPAVEIPSVKFVSVMIEHNKSEFLLCTLIHNHTLQVQLDHCFVEGEEVTYFITGEGTVHLTGYIITDGVGADDSDESEDSEVVPSSSVKRAVKLCKGHKDDSDDDDQDDEDWKPGLKKQKNMPTQINNVPAKSKTGMTVTNSPKKKEKIKGVLEKPPEKNLDSKKHQDEDEDDEEDEDFFIGEEEEEEADSGEDSDEEGNSDWESADEDDAEEETLRRPAKKAKVEEVPKAKGTPTLVKEKSPRIATPTVPTFNQEKGSSKKKQKKHQESPETKTASQKTSNDVSRSSSDSTPQSGSKSRKSIGGVEIQELVQGNGPAAKLGKMVHVYYKGTLPDKREFDSVTKGKAFSFRLGRSEVIKGWDVGIQGMKVGGKRKLIIPPSMGYGNKASGPIPPNSTLHFEVELKAVS